MSVGKLKFGIFKRQGINNKGRITVYNRGGGYKRKLFLIDYKRDLYGIPGKIIKILRSGLSTSSIGLIYYICGYYSYILLADSLKEGDYIITDDSVKYGLNIKEVGSMYKIGQLSLGSEISCIERFRGMGSTYTRVAGSFARIVKKEYLGDLNKVVIKLRSGIFTYVDKDCFCMLGRVSNSDHRGISIRKAGTNRLRGWRPSVRGVAMNPIDHPHGGGQGKTKGGRCSVTPWGRLTKGKKTRHVRKNSKFIIDIN